MQGRIHQAALVEHMNVIMNCMKASTGSGGKTCLYIGALADSYANGTTVVL